MPVEIFCCYAHKDQPLLSRLITQLAPLQSQGIITIWADIDIDAGTEWEKEIEKHLDTAHIILLLVSPDFMASDYSYNREMERALKRHDRGEAKVIPIILRPIHWQESKFNKIQALPKDGKPVTEWKNRDKAYYDVATGIRKVVTEMLKVKDDESSASFAAKFEPSNLSPLGAATPPSIETIQNLTEDTDKEDQQPAQQQTEPDDGDPLIVEPLSKGSPPSEPRRDLVLARPKEVELRQLPPFPSSIMTMMPIQIFSLAIGTFFFWLGYLSLPFVASSSLLWFDVDIIQNVLHLIIGLGGIGLFIEAIFSKSWRDGLFFYNLATAGICLMLGCVGLIPGLSFQHRVLGLMQVNMADNVLHLLTSFLALVFAFFYYKRERQIRLAQAKSHQEVRFSISLVDSSTNDVSD